jgi:hypothetical protein
VLIGCKHVSVEKGLQAARLQVRDKGRWFSVVDQENEQEKCKKYENLLAGMGKAVTLWGHNLITSLPYED